MTATEAYEVSMEILEKHRDLFLTPEVSFAFRLMGPVFLWIIDEKVDVLSLGYRGSLEKYIDLVRESRGNK